MGHQDSPTMFIGLDGEMSSADLADGGALIQAGLAIATGDSYDVFNATLNPGPMAWSERAAQVHGLSREEVQAAPDAAEVDNAAAAWLTERGATLGQRTLIAVGFNVVSFDFPFFRAVMPHTMSMVSRRGVDLNSSCFLLDGYDPTGNGQGRAWHSWKRSAKRQAGRRLATLGIPGQAHNAGWDAAEALAVLDILRGNLLTAADRGRTEAEPGEDSGLVALFGRGLLTRLQPVGADGLDRLAAAFLAAQIPPGRWLGKTRPGLGGRTGLAALIDGDLDTVLDELAR